jgi:hypothetical protein
VHGGADAAAGERDGRAAVLGDHDGLSTVAAAHAAGEEAHALGESDAAFARAHDLATRFQRVERGGEIGARCAETVGQAVDDEVLALRAVESLEDLFLDAGARAQTNTGGWNSPNRDRIASETSPSVA